jgi:hypothetical protein
MRKTPILLVSLLLAGCRMSDMQPDASIGGLTDTSIVRAEAGTKGWMYEQKVAVDFDADGQIETAVLISDVTLDAGGKPLWEDGHRWQVYVDEPTGERTYIYRQFLPNGSLTADVVRRESGTRTLLLIARTPHALNLYEVKYSGPQRIVLMNAIERPIEGAGTFVGSPRP